MASLEIISNQLLPDQKLQWKETKRHGPIEFFGKKPGDKLDPKYFTCDNGSPRIPPNIEDAFNYHIETPKFILEFRQNYFNSMPLSIQQFLLFFFGRGTNPQGSFDNELGFAEGFDYLREGKIKFTFGKTRTESDYVFLESQNLGLHQNGEWGRRNTFTENGKKFMDIILLNKGNLLSVPGLKAEDHHLLSTKLDLIESEYKKGKIEPRDYFYT